MTFPEMNIDVQDPGIGFVQQSANIPVICGVCSKGETNKIIPVGSLRDVRDELGLGPLAEDVALTLQQAGGPVYAVRMDISGVSVSETMEVSENSNVGISGTAYETYSVLVEILSNGGAGEGTFRYALDNFEGVNPSWSQTRTIPSGGTFAVPGTELVFTFETTDETYLEGAVFSGDVAAPEVTAVALADVAEMLDEATSFLFPLWVVSGVQSDETTAAALGAAFQGHLQNLTNTFRYVRGFVDVGSLVEDVDLVLSAADDWTGVRVCPSYGLATRTIPLPFEGFAFRRTGVLGGLGARATRELISSDLSRTASGPDTGVFGVSFDGNVDRRLDAAGISTYRIWPGIPGVYFSNARLKSPAGSDFTDLQFGRVMDVACRTVFEGQFPFISEGFRTIAGGAIDPLDAADVESVVNGLLESALVTPLNARGRPGHVSFVNYSVDRQHNLNLTSTVLTNVAIRPLGYAKVFNTTLSFTLGGE